MAAFLIRRLDPKVRNWLEHDAIELKQPITEVVRQILCAHYDFECPPTRGRQRREEWEYSRNICVRNMDEDVYNALKEDSAETGESMQSLVHQALEEHYGVRS